MHGVDCFDSEYGIGGPLDDPILCEYEVIVESAEQFRESGTYTRSVKCPYGLYVPEAHRRFTRLNPDWKDFVDHNLIRKFGN